MRLSTQFNWPYSAQASIHSIKSRYSNMTSLRDFFNAKYQENSPSFKLAQVN